ncbi:hypothetical protein SD77_1142 [Bacillus badius]|uniref:Uncharacterized protein n=1 Tax=Bacillus badius TaxID=1455 RepID=A0ABR5ASS4_BACBA|nr:hypothetical protein SD78_2748 [Bacillus badius]KIL77813.1 hypothetical protein SD77_1142 [Bacillus badius]
METLLLSRLVLSCQEKKDGRRGVQLSRGESDINILKRKDDNCE